MHPFISFALLFLLALPAWAQMGGVPCGGTGAVCQTNTTQVNGNAALAGAGATGTGSLRTTQAQDTTTIAGSAPGTAGSASANVVTTQPPTNDPCGYGAHTATPISFNASGNTKLVSGMSAKKTYVCGLFLQNAGAVNFSVVEGSGSACATSTLALIGSTTAAAGMNLVANQGFVLSAGNSFWAASTVNANDVCVITSAAVQIAGTIVTVQQ